MQSEWHTTTLKDAGVALIDCDHKTPKAQEAGMPYIGIPQLKEGHIISVDARLITEDDFNHWRRKAKPMTNDIILSRRCNPGVTAYVPAGLEIALGQNLVLLRTDGKILYPPFLRWVVQGPNWWGQVSKYLNVGAVFESLRCAHIPSFEVKLPPLPTQKKIAHILSTLDDKIELNRKMNQTLEEMAQALFKSWFVDFDPVHAKIGCESDAELEKAAAELGISKEILELFPGEFEESEMGMIPKGWEVKSLDKIAHYQNGLALQKFRPKDEKYFLPVLKIAQLKKGYADGEEKADVNIKPECIVDSGDVVFSWSGSLVVDVWCGGKVALNQHLFKVTSNDYAKWFYYYWTKQHLSNFQRVAAAKAVTMGHIKKSHLSEAMCVVPDDAVFDMAETMINPLLEKLILNRLEINSLQRTRDTLLPKLLSGELDVSEIEVEKTDIIANVNKKVN